MTFTLPSIIASVAAGQGIFLGSVLLTKKENRQSNTILAILLFVLAFALFQWVLWWTGLIERWPGFKGTNFCLPLLYGPLMYLFYQSTFENKKFRLTDTLHFLPAALSIFFMLPFYLRFFENLSDQLSWIPLLGRSPWYSVFVFAQMTGYGIWISLKYSKYFSENIELRKWHRLILAAYWGIIFTYLFYRLLSLFGLRGNIGWIYLIAASLSVFIYIIAWLGYIEPRVFAGQSLSIAANPVKYKKSSLTSERSKSLFDKIKDQMEFEKLYCKDDFSLNMLAKEIGEQRYHVSQSVNEQSGMSFPRFVNAYRVRDAQQLLSSKSKQEMNVSEVAFAVGFSTKKAFNLAFKDKTGMTPSEYRRNGNGKSKDFK